MPTYLSDGTGRDLYIGYNNGGLSFKTQTQYTGKSGKKAGSEWSTSSQASIGTAAYAAPRSVKLMKATKKIDSWSTTTGSHFKWPSLTSSSRAPPSPFKGATMKSTNSFTLPRNKEFVYPNGILFQYEDDIQTPLRKTRRAQFSHSHTSELPNLDVKQPNRRRAKSVSPKASQYMRAKPKNKAAFRTGTVPRLHRSGPI